MSSNLESQFLASLASAQNAVITDTSTASPTALQTALDAIRSAITHPTLTIDQALEQVLATGSTPTSITSFLDQVAVAMGSANPPTGSVASAITAAFSAFQSQFNADLLLGTSPPSAESNLLTGVVNPASPPSTMTQTEYLNNAFAQFIANYQSLQGPASAATDVSFLNNWGSFTAVTATLLSDSTGSKLNKGNLASYQALYTQAFGSSPSVSFTSFVQTFINNEVATKGFFLPSMSLPDFTSLLNDITKHLTAATFVSPSNTTLTADVTSLESTTPAGFSLIANTNSSKVKVMITVLIQLVNMLDSLQQTGIQQSNLLNFYTNWQTAYTESANNVPILTGAETSGPFANQSSEAQSYDGFAEAVSQNLRDTRDLIGDNAKTEESNINNTNQAEQQAASLGTSILQQLNTIMQSLLQQ
jgi:hypothetical protein